MTGWKAWGWIVVSLLWGLSTAACGSDGSALPETEVCEEEIASDAELRTGDPCECVGQEATQQDASGCTYTCVCGASGWFCQPCEASSGVSGPGISDETSSAPELVFTGEIELAFVEDGQEGDPADGVARGDRIRVSATLAVENSASAWSDILVQAEADASLEVEEPASVTLDSLDREGAQVSFVVRVRSTAQSGPARLTMRASADGLVDANPRVATIDVALGPVLTLQTLRWRTADGGEGALVSELQPGETYRLTGAVGNSGAEVAEGVDVEFLLENDDLSLVEPPEPLGDLDPAQDVPFEARFTVAAVPSSTEANVSVIASAGAVSAERAVSVAIAPPVSTPLLLTWGTPERTLQGEDTGLQTLVLLCPEEGSGENPPLVCTGECSSCGDPECVEDEGSVSSAGILVSGVWSVDVTNDGDDSLEDLDWEARILVLCEDCDLVTDPQARCYGTATGINVSGPASLAPAESDTVEVTFTLTTRTSRYLGLVLTAARGASSTTEVFNSEGELWDRFAD